MTMEQGIPDGQRDAWRTRLFHERLRGGRVVPFVGAGISFPVFKKGWIKVIEELAQLPGLERRIGADLITNTAKSHDLTIVSELIRQYLPMESVVQGLKDALQCPAKGVEFIAKTRVHRLMMSGPWPAVITTNWDELLEEAWKADEHRPLHRLWGSSLTPYYRRDIERFHGAMKAGLRPLLLKVHGDTSELGNDEIVLSYRDYRSVIHGDGRLSSLMGWLASEYSLLFYGQSMTDPDLLQFLAATHEGLGQGIGPHFWVTADKVASAMERFLRERFNVHTIQLDTTGVDMAEAYEAWLAEVHAYGWQTREGFVAGCTLTVPSTDDRGKVRLLLDTSPLPPPDSLTEGAVVVSVARVGGKVHQSKTATTQLCTTLPGREAAIAQVMLDPEGVPDRAVEGRYWLLAGQDTHGYGRPSRINAVVRAWMKMRLQEGESVFHLPLIAAGGGNVPTRLAMQALMHAVGSVVRETKPSQELTVHVHLMVTPGALEGKEPSLVREIEQGVFDPVESLRRGLEGTLRVTVLHPRRDDPDRNVVSVLYLPEGAFLMRGILDVAGWTQTAGVQVEIPVEYQRTHQVCDAATLSGDLRDLRDHDITDGTWIRLICPTSAPAS